MAQRKRRRSMEKERQWRRALRGQAKSGLSIRDYCRQHQLAENSFYYWRGELARRDSEKAATVRDKKMAPSSPAPSFAAVTVVDPVSHLSPVIEIELGTKVRVRLFPGFDAAAVGDVLAALRSHLC